MMGSCTGKKSFGSVLAVVLVALAVISGCGHQMVRKDAPGATAGREVSNEVKREVENLSSPDPATRVNAAIRLGRMGPRAIPAIPELAKVLGDMYPVPLPTGKAETTAGMEAARALAQIGGASLDALAHVLTQENADARRKAVWALGEIGDPRAVPFLADALGDWKVQGEGVEAMRRIDHRLAVATLVDGLGDSSAFRRERASWGLMVLGDPAAVPPLIKALQDPNENVRKMATKALVGMDDPRVVAPLIENLDDPDFHVRRITASALGRIGDPRAVPHLEESLRSDRAMPVREMAALALGQINDPHAVESLLAALEKDERFVMSNAAKALGMLKSPRAVGPLQATLSHEEPRVRASAAEALGRIGDPRSVDSLSAALKDDIEHVSVQAAKSLGEIGDSRAVGSLIEALKDRRRTVKYVAATSLVKITGVNFQMNYEQWQKWHEGHGSVPVRTDR